MRTIRTLLAAAALVAVTVPTAASANQCNVFWKPSENPVPSIVC
jgi:hypothetical protein